MTPLEAARLLAEEDILQFGDYATFCPACGGLRAFDAADKHIGYEHDGCPWLALPQIVAALEAATNLVNSLDKTADGPPNYTLRESLRRALKAEKD